MISLCASAVNTHLWSNFMWSLQDNKVDYEVVFVGDRRPEQDIPFLRFIYSEVKPAQCHQIAVSEANGEIIHITADDAIYPPHFLDDVDEMFRNGNMCICCETIENGHYCNWDSFRFGHFIMSPFAFFRKSDWVKVGGYDNRYLTGQFENDFCMKLHAERIPFVPYKKKQILVNHITGSEFSRWHDVGRMQLRESWAVNKYHPDCVDNVQLTRRDIACPYDDATLYTMNQGAVGGKWK